MPASGCLPSVMNAVAARGIRIRYPASDATLDSTPTKIRKNAIRFRGATWTSLRISAAISPAFSATPTPAIATNVTATTAKPAKLLTNEEKTKRMPSTASRLRTSNVCSCTRYSGISTSCPVITSYGTTEPPSASRMSRISSIGTGTATLSVTDTSNAARIADSTATPRIR